MQQRILGNDLQVSALGLGCMGMSHAYGAPGDRQEMMKVLGEAVDMGYTFFDTAEVYGTPEEPHHNESLVGEGLQPYRDKVVIATKFGHRFDYESGKVPFPLISDSRPETIRKSVEGSLKRLRTDHIDLYYQHRPDPKVGPETVAETMNELIQEGKILHWGVSEAPADYICRAHSICPITAIQNRYSMMARWHESLFPLLEELHIGLVAFSPLANGLLSDAYKKGIIFSKTDDYRAYMPQFTDNGFDANRDLIALLHNLSAAHKCTPAQISLAWMLSKKPYIVPIPGTRKMERLKENAQSAEVRLSTEDVRKIDKALDECQMSDVFGSASRPR